jgi:hypothetical protein
MLLAEVVKQETPEVDNKEVTSSRLNRQVTTLVSIIRQVDKK